MVALVCAGSSVVVGLRGHETQRPDGVWLDFANDEPCLRASRHFLLEPEVAGSGLLRWFQALFCAYENNGQRPFTFRFKPLA